MAINEGRVRHDLVKEARAKMKMSQAELASETGLSTSLIKAVETNRCNVSKKNAKKLGEILGLKLEDFFLEDYRETRVIAIMNNKGGCAKTTTTSCLGYNLAEMGYKVLLIDADMQKHLSISFNLDQSETDDNIFDIMKKRGDFKNCIVKTQYKNIDFIVGHSDMSTIEMEMFPMMHREEVFKDCINETIIKGVYDFILIDSSPTLAMLSYNILNASHYIIVPIELTKFGIQGIETLLKFYNKVKKVNPSLNIAGMLPTKADYRENITHEAESGLRGSFDNLVFKTTIPVDVTIKKAQWDSIPLKLFDVKSRASEYYKEFTKEVIKIVKK